MTDRLEQLETRWANDPESRIFLQLAEEYRRGGRAADAIPVLEKGLEHHGNWIGAQVCLGRCRLETGNPVGAAACLEAVVRKDPTQLMAYRLLVEAYIDLHDAESATDRLQLYDQLNEGDPEVELLRERVSALQGGEPAVSVAEVATEGDASDHEALIDEDDTASEVSVMEIPPEEAPPLAEAPTLEAVTLVEDDMAEQPELAVVDEDSYALDQPISAEFEAPVSLDPEPASAAQVEAQEEENFEDETMELSSDSFGQTFDQPTDLSAEEEFDAPEEVVDAQPELSAFDDQDEAAADDEDFGEDAVAASDWHHAEPEELEAVVESSEAMDDVPVRTPVAAVAAGPVPAASNDGPLTFVPSATPPPDLVSVLTVAPPRILRPRERRSPATSNDLPEAPEVPEPAAPGVLAEESMDRSGEVVPAPLPFKRATAEVVGEVVAASSSPAMDALRLSGSMPALDLSKTLSEGAEEVSAATGLWPDDEPTAASGGLSTLGPTTVDVRETGAMSVRELVGDAVAEGDSEVEKKSNVLKSYLDRLQSNKDD